MVTLSATISILYYYLIFPAMEDELDDWLNFLLSAIYFCTFGLLFYYVIEPALLRAFSKSGRFTTDNEDQTTMTIMKTTFFAVNIFVYVVVLQALLNKRKRSKKKKLDE